MSDKSVKRIIRVLFRVLVDVFIVIVLIRFFLVGYNFCYSVFTDHAANVASVEKQRFVIEKEDTTKEIVASLADAGLVEDQYVMLAKVYLSSYHGKMQPGTYMLSASMPPSKIMKTITGNLDEEDENKNTDVDTDGSPQEISGDDESTEAATDENGNPVETTEENTEENEETEASEEGESE